MVFRLLLKAYKGKYLWEKLKRKYGRGLKPSRYIMFLNNDIEYNAWAIYYFDKFVEEEKLDKVMIITSDDDVIDALKNSKHCNLHFIKLNEDDILCIVRLAALVNLGEELTIVSVKDPYDTGAERLLGKKGVTKREILWFDIYRFTDDFVEIENEDAATWKNVDKFADIWLK